MFNCCWCSIISNTQVKAPLHDLSWYQPYLVNTNIERVNQILSAAKKPTHSAKSAPCLCLCLYSCLRHILLFKKYPSMSYFFIIDYDRQYERSRSFFEGLSRVLLEILSHIVDRWCDAVSSGPPPLADFPASTSTNNTGKSNKIIGRIWRLRPCCGHQR